MLIQHLFTDAYRRAFIHDTPHCLEFIWSYCDIVFAKYHRQKRRQCDRTKNRRKISKNRCQLKKNNSANTDSMLFCLWKTMDKIGKILLLY